MPDQAATTNGWDTVYGIPITSVNASIVAAGSSPPSFSQGGDDPIGGDYTISGDFTAWQIVQGGSGTLLHLETPIPAMTFTPANPEVQPAHFTQGSVIVEIDLQYLPSEASPPPGSTGTFHDLRLKSMVRVVSSSFAESDYSSYRAFVETTILAWYNANIAAFSHVFATVNLDRTAAKDQFAWLLPTACSYSYVDVVDQVGILGVLCMTGGRTPPKDQQLSPNVIPQGSSAGFLIAQARLMQDLLLPAMPQSFKGTTSEDYQISDDFQTITLGDGDVALQLPQPSDHTPYLETLTVSIFSDTQLQVMTQTKANILDQICGMGEANQQLYPDQHSNPESVAIWSWCKTTSNFTIGLVTLPNGTKSLDFTVQGTPDQEHWTEQSEGMKIFEDILEVIAVLVTLVLGVLTDGAGFIIGAMVIGILTSLVTQALPQLIATLGTNDAPSIDLLVINATDPIRWPSGTGFDIDFAGLNGALQLGGSISAG